MTFKVCVNLVGLASLCVLATLSSRISEEIHRGKMLTTALRLLHLYAFATWVGMQFWVTFVAGEYVEENCASYLLRSEFLEETDNFIGEGTRSKDTEGIAIVGTNQS